MEKMLYFISAIIMMLSGCTGSKPSEDAKVPALIPAPVSSCISEGPFSPAASPE
ncbi:MAG: hypothetical protein MUE74_10665 [Bacteroidales bacterium]|nr:hypothetical protein [Bacteroidales bacterium]